MEAEKAYKQAKTPSEKLECLERMLSVIPKHKGTEKMQGDIKRRISQLKERMERESARKRGGVSHVIRREGAGKVVLIGPPNTGKSQLICSLTNARPEVAPYPFATRIPVPGIISFENAKMTLVDTPPITSDFRDADLSGFLRKADLTLLVVDPLDPEVLELIDAVIESLAEVKIKLASEENRGRPGQVSELKTIVVANKMDLEGARETVDVLKEFYPDLPYLLISAESGEGLEDFARELFLALDVVRGYTKKPGKKPEFNDPVYLKRGQTVLDFARDIHKDFAENLKFARIWGEGMHDGQSVARDHQVNDGDIIELHI